MKNLFLFLFTLIISSQVLFAQLKAKDNLLGGSVGVWAYGNVPTFGANFETNITQAGPGTIGLGGLFRYYSFTNHYTNGDYRKYSFSSVGFQTNYNFNKIGKGKFVPYAGLVIGYNFVNNNYTDVTGHNIYYYDVNYDSGSWIWAQFGARYFFSKRVAGTVRLGAGNNDFNALELGLDIKL